MSSWVLQTAAPETRRYRSVSSTRVARQANLVPFELGCFSAAERVDAVAVVAEIVVSSRRRTLRTSEVLALRTDGQSDYSFRRSTLEHAQRKTVKLITLIFPNVV